MVYLCGEVVFLGLEICSNFYGGSLGSLSASGTDSNRVSRYRWSGDGLPLPARRVAPRTPPSRVGSLAIALLERGSRCLVPRRRGVAFGGGGRRRLLLLLPQALRCVTCNSEDAWNTTSRWTSTWSRHARPKV